VWVETAVRYILSLGVPPSKISLGLPSYSQWWYAAYDVESGAHVDSRGINHEEAISLLRKKGVESRWDDQQKEAFGVWEENGVNQFLSLSDVRSFAARVALRDKYKLRGYSVWVLGFEDPKVWDATSRIVR
jgi:spore germination protein YaaH